MVWILLLLCPKSVFHECSSIVKTEKSKKQQSVVKNHCLACDIDFVHYDLKNPLKYLSYPAPFFDLSDFYLLKLDLVALDFENSRGPPNQA